MLTRAVTATLTITFTLADSGRQLPLPTGLGWARERVALGRLRARFTGGSVTYGALRLRAESEMRMDPARTEAEVSRQIQA
jgi:hypothetical protein